MDDLQDIDPFAGTISWTISGLQNGKYRVFTYAWDPANSGVATLIDVVGSTDPLQSVGGIWNGPPHVLGVTYCLHHVAISNGVMIVHAAAAPGHHGSINGFQLVFDGGTGGGASP